MNMKKTDGEKFNQAKYMNEWKKENMSLVGASYKSSFVQEFKEACKTLGVSQSSLIRNMMEETIKKAKQVQKK